MLPFLVLTAGYSVSRIKNTYLFTSFVLLFASISIYSVINVYYPKPKEDWRGTTNYVVAESKPGDALILYPQWILSPFNYYRKQKNAPNNFVDLIYPARDFDNLDACYPDMIPEYGKSTIAGYQRVWLVVSPGHAPKNDLSGSMYASLGKQFQLEAERKFNGVKVFLFGKKINH